MSSFIRNSKVLPFVIATPLLLSACGGGDTDSASGGDQPQSGGGSLEAVCESASQEDGEAIWYESSLPEQAEEIISSFNETYPDIEVTHQRVTGGAGIAGLVIQEQQAGSRTADLVTGSPDIVSQLADRQLVLEMEQADLGITDSALMPEPYAVHTVDAVPVFAYNTNLVEESEAPQSWDDLVSDDWAGKLNMWNRFGVTFAELVPEWGEEKTRQYVDELAATDPKLNESTFAIAQEVGAGTSPIGLGFYHTTMEVMETGAPLEIVVPADVVPISPLYSGIVKETPNPMSAQCFLGWMVSPEGAKSYEDATLRGNHRIEGTNTQELLAEATTSMTDFSDIEETTENIIEFNEVLAE